MFGVVAAGLAEPLLPVPRRTVHSVVFPIMCIHLTVNVCLCHLGRHLFFFRLRHQCLVHHTGQTPSTGAADHRVKILSLLNGYLHGLPSNSVMHTHADSVQRRTRNSSSAAPTLMANERNPDSTLLSKLVSTRSCAIVPDANMGQEISFPLCWPPSDSSRVNTDGQLTAAAQVRDLDAWYRSYVTAAPFVADVCSEPLHCGATSTRARRSNAHPGTQINQSSQSHGEMMLHVVMDVSVCQQLLSDISVLDTSQAASAHVACLKDLKVKHSHC